MGSELLGDDTAAASTAMIVPCMASTSSKSSVSADGFDPSAGVAELRRSRRFGRLANGRVGLVHEEPLDETKTGGRDDC